MSKLKVYQYDKCSTCQKALKFLKAKGHQFEVIDITTNPPTTVELEKMLKAYAGDFKKLFNTSGVQYRELKISEKIPTMTAEQAIKLLAGNGRLIKRPFVLHAKGGLVGFKEEEWSKI